MVGPLAVAEGGEGDRLRLGRDLTDIKNKSKKTCDRIVENFCKRLFLNLACV
jgi:hypothetical protein